MSNSSTINVDIVVTDKGAINAVQRFGKEVETAGAKGEKSLKSLNATTKQTSGGMLEMAKTVAIYSGAFAAMSAVVNGVVSEFKAGLSSIEDFNMSVAQTTALITTFSQKGKDGDMAGAFAEAYEYSQALANEMEVIDTKTIANADHLRAMNQTFIANGVQIDINNKKQVEGFTATANALAILTQGMDQEKQMRQEIRGLMDGSIGPADTLGRLLKAQIPDIEEQLQLWRQEGTVLEHLGGLLEGFNSATKLLENNWAVVGSTMDTIHKKILRGAFKPIFEDLIGLAKDINKSLMDAEGHLTPLAKSIQDDVAGGYETAKRLIKEYGGEVAIFTGLAIAAKVAQYAFNVAVSKNPYIMAATALGILNEQMESFGLDVESGKKAYDGYTSSAKNVIDVMRGIRDADTGKVFTEQEQTLNKIKTLQDSLSANKEWYQFKIFEDPSAEKQHVADVTAEIGRLKESLQDASRADTDMQRERMRAGGEYKAQAVALAKSTADEEVKESKRAATEAIRNAERLAEDRRRLSEEVTDALAKEGMTQTEQAKYELDKQYAADLKLAGDDMALAAKVTAFYKSELAKRTKDDNDWAAFSAKQHLAAAEKIKDGWQVAAEGRADADEIANQRIEEGTEQTTNLMIEGFGRAADDIEGYMADIFQGAEFSFDSILDIFKRMLAEMLAAIIMSGIKAAFLDMWNTGSMSGAGSAFMSGISSAFGSGNSSGGTVDASGAASGWGKVGGGLAVAGGAYGMYSGAQNMKEGNAGVGALQMGLGGVSAYKGAVTLGALKEGAATGAYKAIAAKMGFSAAAPAGSTTAAAGTTSYSAGAGATSYGTFQAGATSAGSSGAGVGAGAAGAAAYAIPIAAAVLVAVSAWQKSQRPSAQNQIDEAGITPAHLSAFTKGMREVQNSILATVPTLARYESAVYNANASLLVATGSTGTIALRYDEAAAAGHQWSLALSVGSEAFRQAAEKSVSIFGEAGEGMGKAGELAAAERDALAVLNAEMNGTKTITGLTADAIADLNSQSRTATSGFNELSPTIQTAGSAAAQAAPDIMQLINGIGGIASAANWATRSMENFDSSAYSSHVAPVSYQQGDLSYHASGGIFTKPAQIGNHIFGESGMEALLPLPNGPDTLRGIISRLDRIESGMGGYKGPSAIVVNIAGREIKRELLPIIDAQVTSQARRGQLGQRTAYATS